MSKASIFKQIFKFILERKAYAIAPLLITFVILGFVFFSLAGTPVAPFIYTLF